MVSTTKVPSPMDDIPQFLKDQKDIQEPVIGGTYDEYNHGPVSPLDTPVTPSASSSRHNSKHISVHSRSELLATDSWLHQSMEKVPQIPAIYTNGRLNSTNSLLLQAAGKLEPYEALGNVSIEHMPPPQGPPTNDHPELKIGGFHEFCFIAAVVLAQFFCLAGLGQAIAPVKIISAGLGVNNPGQEAWFSAAYSLTTGTFILIAGRLGDILGHKRVFVFGYLFLGIWSGFAGFSAYVGRQIFFDVCRGMQGIGSALLAPNALALLGRAYPPGIKKNLTFALFGAMAPWGFVIGALFGALFSQTTWWPWTFWSYGAAAFGMSAFSLLVVPKQLAKEAQFAGVTHVPGFDWTGSALGVIGLVLVNIAFNNGPLYGWSTPHVYFVLIIGLLVLVAFLWVERRASSPLLPVSAFNATVTYTMALIGIGWGSFGIWIYYSWRFLEEFRHLSPLNVSAQFTPALVCGLIAAGATGFMLTHTPVSFTMLIAMLAFFVGQVITAFMPVNQSYWPQMFVSILIMPFGMDMSFPAATVILSNHMPREHQGLAASLVNTMVNYSISLALGIAGTVEVSVMTHDGTITDSIWGVRCAFFTGLALAGCGLLLGISYFVKSMVKEGWKVAQH
ncbi:MFS general substrate transporter [Aureobasidium pullulans]|uniref:MFS general substrate transporter n=1 Tax=Aureobasidium pullulans TaxID=5580 RepID=A0A4S9LCT8_AURPU|nr:MFS general substrate transporter [Aureobasidium pullulans]